MEREQSVTDLIGAYGRHEIVGTWKNRVSVWFKILCVRVAFNFSVPWNFAFTVLVTMCKIACL